jgi:hypothetical protein
VATLVAERVRDGGTVVIDADAPARGARSCGAAVPPRAAVGLRVPGDTVLVLCAKVDSMPAQLDELRRGRRHPPDERGSSLIQADMSFY